MIQVATFPADLGQWNEDEVPVYLEIFGETGPLIDKSYAETLAPGAVAAQASQPIPIYEYWWTIGHGGYEHGPHKDNDGERSGLKRFHRSGKGDKTFLWTNLDDPAARVYFYFPISGGWRIKELVATVKYLSPVEDQKNWSAKAAGEFQRMQPLMANAGQLASDFGAVPFVGGAAPILSTLSKFQVNTVPQGVNGFDWSVGKVTMAPTKGHGANGHGVMQGVVWTLPKQMFALLGGRLTGSLAVSFIPSQFQSIGEAKWIPESLPMLSHAVIYANGSDHWVPKDKFVELTLSPTDPTPGS
jgi:hypothetical protein